ncbi:hypothetical protein EA462_13500 [Natrarchaeobius halalkaliphilus]|uniref:Uncharacterized protein n=1 Tax=Natrarchaeobius halalkaliphilus TaxID=1679091 RepID=A0A3N6LYV5_9EURY|nr:hypothetical protein [Natrarchaeobius halalkaliphilus]RQG87873.1 hypothetical protein EA462_13500 [Natrarchaeobius halalkaliphilus]
MNEGIVRIATEHLDRFAGVATEPMNDPDAMIEELERAVTDLDVRFGPSPRVLRPGQAIFGTDAPFDVGGGAVSIERSLRESGNWTSLTPTDAEFTARRYSVYSRSVAVSNGARCDQGDRT